MTNIPLRNFWALLMHVVLVVVGVWAAMTIVNSPNPVVGLIVLMLVLGVEIPVALWQVLGGRAAGGDGASTGGSPPTAPPPTTPTAPG